MQKYIVTHIRFAHSISIKKSSLKRTRGREKEKRSIFTENSLQRYRFISPIVRFPWRHGSQRGDTRSNRTQPPLSLHIYIYIYTSPSPRPASKSSRTRGTSLRAELNLHEIPVGVPLGVANVAPVDVSDFRGLGISMRRGSRFADACHVHARALHSCGAGLKGRHVMPFSQSLCRISVKERERGRERDLRPPPSLDLFCKAPALIEPSKAKRRIETSTKDNRRRAGIKVFEKLMKRREKVRHPSRMAAVLSPRFKNMNGLMGVVHRRERCNRKGMYSVSKEN